MNTQMQKWYQAPHRIIALVLIFALAAGYWEFHRGKGIDLAFLKFATIFLSLIAISCFLTAYGLKAKESKVKHHKYAFAVTYSFISSVGLTAVNWKPDQFDTGTIMTFSFLFILSSYMGYSQVRQPQI